MKVSLRALWPSSSMSGTAWIVALPYDWFQRQVSHQNPEAVIIRVPCKFKKTKTNPTNVIQYQVQVY